eukprot:6205562-Pleurochrysis_carterae.AAC.1
MRARTAERTERCRTRTGRGPQANKMRAPRRHVEPPTLGGQDYSLSVCNPVFATGREHRHQSGIPTPLACAEL